MYRSGEAIDQLAVKFVTVLAMVVLFVLTRYALRESQECETTSALGDALVTQIVTIQELV